MANGTTKITRTFGTPTDRDKWTLSMWFKLSQIQEQGIFHAHIDASNYTNLEFGTSGQLTLYDKLAGAGSCTMVTDRLFRDFSAWYHLVISWDSGNATEGDRVIFWVNGVRETSFSTETYPAQDANSAVNGANLHEIGAKLGSYDFAGNMSHVQFVDGSILTPTSFGSVSPGTGEWIISPSCYGTPGNNGFCLKMEDRTNLDLDSSSNANTFATTGTLTATEDNPSDNFATMNSLTPLTTNFSYKHGNTTVAQAGTAYWVKTNSTLGMTKGKWYWEAKYVSGLYTVISVSRTTSGVATSGMPPDGVGYKRNGEVHISQSNVATLSTYAHGDIIGCYLDMDNEAVYFAKNGVLENSGVPTSGASKTGGFALPVSDVTYFASISPYSSGETSMNFGNGYFGTTAISSEGTNASGRGKFEYDVPTGYTALSTKGLNA